MSNQYRNKMKRVGAHVASLLHLYMSPQTPSAQVRDLVDRLVPWDLGVPLRRLGGDGDGGYLVPDDFEGIASCFSPGVAEKASFEEELADMGIRSFLADYSVRSAPDTLRDCDFVKKFVGAANSDHVLTLDRWVNEKCPPGSTGDMILQMDIEGAEYETLMATSSDTLSRFRMIVLELHKLNHLDNKLYFRFVNAALSRLLEQFDVAHVHANNSGGLTRMAGIAVPRAIEITLLRKDRVIHRRPVHGLPHQLDSPNTPGLEELVLPDYWYKPARAA